jgi:hypothetical protein
MQNGCFGCAAIFRHPDYDIVFDNLMEVVPVIEGPDVVVSGQAVAKDLDLAIFPRRGLNEI